LAPSSGGERRAELAQVATVGMRRVDPPVRRYNGQPAARMELSCSLEH